VEPEGRREDALVLVAMMNKITGEQPVMWGSSIVGFGSFHYSYASGHQGDMPVISFSPRKSAMSVYGVYYPEYEELIADIGPYKTGKWCLYLGSFSRLNLDILEKAIAWAWNNGIPVIADQLTSSHSKSS